METRTAWRLLGALGVAQLVVLFSGFAFKAPVVELGSSRERLRHALVDTAQWRGLASNYTELVFALLVLGFGTLLAALVRRGDPVGRWLSSMIAASAVATAGLTVVSAAAGGVTHYDAHHAGTIETLASMDHFRDFMFFGSVATLGLLAVVAGAAIIRTRVFPVVLGGAGIVVGLASVVSVLGAVGGAHNIANLATLVWMLAISIAAFRVRDSAIS